MAISRTESKTGDLRFVERDGKRILQQQVIIGEHDPDNRSGSVYHEWHDVPLVNDNGNMQPQ